jgi:hypothetical protein
VSDESVTSKHRIRRTGSRVRGHNEMPNPRGSGIAPVVSRELRPYRYRGRDTEPDPAEIVARIHARLERKHR